MNPGPVEEVGKAAGTFMESLKREPLSLALVVMNLALLVFFYIILSSIASARQREVALLFEEQKQVREMLSKCIVPGKASAEFDNAASIPLPKSKPPEAQ